MTALSGTNEPSSNNESLLGKIVLMDYSSYLIGVDDADMLYVSLAETISNLVAAKELVKTVFG